MSETGELKLDVFIDTMQFFHPGYVGISLTVSKADPDGKYALSCKFQRDEGRPSMGSTEYEYSEKDHHFNIRDSLRLLLFFQESVVKASE